MARMSDTMAAKLRKLSARELAMLDALTGFAVGLASRTVAPDDLIGIDMEELADLIAVLLGHKGQPPKSDSAPLPSDDGASAMQFDAIRLLQPWWREQKQKA